MGLFVTSPIYREELKLVRVLAAWSMFIVICCFKGRFYDTDPAFDDDVMAATASRGL